MPSEANGAQTRIPAGQRLKLKKIPAPPPRSRASSASTGRLTALDGLRGLFAVDVILFHFFATLPLDVGAANTWIIWTPVRFAPAIVVTFFMMSGFVLALPYDTDRPPTYFAFITKRIFRIYVPYAVLLFAAFVLFRLTGVGPETIRDLVYHGKGTVESGPFTFRSLTGVMLMTGTRVDTLLNPAAWSLIQEMRLAVLFPLLILLCRNTWISFVAMALCYVFVFQAKTTLGNFIWFPSVSDYPSSIWLTTVYIAPSFICGILIAKYRRELVRMFRDFSPFVRVTIWSLVACNMYVMSDFDVQQPFTEFGSAALIVLVLSSDFVSEILELPVFQWLGKLSYSLYLVHPPVLFALRHVLDGRVNLFFTYLACVVVTVPVAVVTQHFIEAPAQRFGKKLAAGFGPAR